MPKIKNFVKKVFYREINFFFIFAKNGEIAQLVRASDS